MSKWQSNVQPGRPWDNSPSPSSWHNDIDQRPGGPGPGSYAPPHHGPNSGYHHNQNTQNFNGNGNNNWPSGGGGGGPPRPSWGSLDGPSSSQWDQDRPGASQDYRPERPSRPSSWDSSRPNKWERPSQPEQWVSSADPDIITDNSPPDFPAHPAQQASRPGGSYTYGPGPASASSGRPWGGDRPHREVSGKREAPSVWP